MKIRENFDNDIDYFTEIYEDDDDEDDVDDDDEEQERNLINEIEQGPTIQKGRTYWQKGKEERRTKWKKIIWLLLIIIIIIVHVIVFLIQLFEMSYFFGVNCSKRK